MATNNTSSSNPRAEKMGDVLDALSSGIAKTAANEPKFEPQHLVPEVPAEPELNALWPAGIGMVAARMTSLQPTIEARLVEYYLRLDGTVQQFGNAPMGVVASACTGSSYLMGPAREDELFSSLHTRLGIPVTNSALAVVAALKSLGARRIGLVSPYPRSLTE